MKDIENFGFVILCPERNFGGLKCTVNSIRNHFPDKPYLCVVSENASKNEVEEFNTVCRTVKGGPSYTSLINLGIRENRAKWSFVVMAGFPLRHGTLRRYQMFVQNEKHIAFSVVNRKWTFDESSLNGFFVHRSALEDVGDFDEEPSDLNNVRLLWATEAIEKGYEFRAIVGVPR